MASLFSFIIQYILLTTTLPTFFQETLWLSTKVSPLTLLLLPSSLLMSISHLLLHASPNYRPDFTSLFSIDGDALITGDFNAHHQGWHSLTEDARAADRGEDLFGASVGNGFCILNGDTPTRLPKRGPSSSPDIAFVSGHLALDSQWSTHTQLSSDHLPITISLSCGPTKKSYPRACYYNYKKADWPSFTQFIEDKLEDVDLPVSCSSGEKILREICLSSAKQFIPSGFIRNFIPGLSNEAKDLIKERDALRSMDPDHPDLPDIEHSVSATISECARVAWVEKVESCNHRQNTGRFWSLLRSLSGKRPSSSPNQPISFSHKQHSKLTDISRAFCKQFTGTEPRVRHANSRNLARHFKLSHSLDHNFAPFIAGLVQEAIKSSGNSTAVGPDKINILLLKHFGPIAINFLTALFNLSIANADVPSIWKMATIIPIPKPGKSPSEGASYRPISLLCPAVKILERLVLPYLTSHLDLADTQHGFRALRSTTTALLPLVDRIVRGFNQPKPPLRTVSLAVDFSRAFDTVSHDLLINMIGSSNLPHNVVRWILDSFLLKRSRCSRPIPRDYIPFPPP